MDVADQNRSEASKFARTITVGQIDQLLELLRGGHFKNHACQVAGISETSLYRLVSEDEELARMVDEAYEQGAGFIESLAVKRAIEGVTEITVTQVVQPGQDPKDAPKKIVEKHRYDNPLLLRLLERRLKEWRRDAKPETSLSLTKQASLNYTKLEMVDVGETLAKALPEGLGSALRDVLGRNELEAGDGRRPDAARAALARPR